jgi:feruloyl esterase
MVEWVESGTAPDSILATNVSNGVVTRSRPLCPWPQTALYNGTGDPNDAASFTCGGNVETRTASCLDIVARYQNETSTELEPTGRRNPATCNLSPPSGVR